MFLHQNNVGMATHEKILSKNINVPMCKIPNCAKEQLVTELIYACFIHSFHILHFLLYHKLLCGMKIPMRTFLHRNTE